LYTVDSVSKTSIISMVYVASSMLSAKGFGLPKKLESLHIKKGKLLGRAAFFTSVLLKGKRGHFVNPEA